MSALTSIETAIGLAYDTNISDILIVGDFNLDMQKPVPGRKVDNLCQRFNLHNLILLILLNPLQLLLTSY